MYPTFPQPFFCSNTFLNPLNAKLNSICHLLALLEAHHILHVSRIRINIIFPCTSDPLSFWTEILCYQLSLAGERDISLLRNTKTVCEAHPAALHSTLTTVPPSAVPDAIKYKFKKDKLHDSIMKALQ
jgi:hypothetical protein